MTSSKCSVCAYVFNVCAEAFFFAIVFSSHMYVILYVLTGHSYLSSMRQYLTKKTMFKRESESEGCKISFAS